MKACSKCKEVQPLSSFLKHKECKNGRAGVCLNCWRSYQKLYRRENRGKDTDRLRRNKLYWIEKFGDKCHDCDKSFPPCVYDFHHLEGKDVNPSQAISWSKERAEKELKKCIMLCANCHRIRHFGKEVGDEGVD